MSAGNKQAKHIHNWLSAEPTQSHKVKTAFEQPQMTFALYHQLQNFKRDSEKIWAEKPFSIIDLPDMCEYMTQILFCLGSQHWFCKDFSQV